MTETSNSLMARARALAGRGDLRQAVALSLQAARQAPDSADAWYLHGMLNLRFGRLHNAGDSLRRANALRPEDEGLVIELVSVLEQLEDYDGLAELHEASIGRLPESTVLRMSRSRILASLGDFKAARAGYLWVLERAPGHVDATCALVQAGCGEDVGGLEGLEAQINASDEHSADYIKLLYARARLLEAEKRFDEAYRAYREANAKQAARGGMDIQAKQRAAVTVMNDLSPSVVGRLAGKGHPSKRPVFIVGMPRSGTSLTEQVLSRHPEIHSIGEHKFLGEVLRDLITRAPKAQGPLPDAIDGMGADAWRLAGGEYLRRVEEIDGASRRVTDKLPANFALLPWLRLLLPQARIIHVRRNPLATLASCIRTPFADNLLSFTIEDWARFYGLYEALMERWRPILGDTLLEVEYEELVSDLPGQARRMVEFLELDWADACLSPERARRAVRTASFTQVRHGVHTGSVDKWLNYRDPLRALESFIRESREHVASQTVD